MSSSVNISSLLGLLKFTVTILLPKYKSNTFLLLNVILRHCNFLQEKTCSFQLKPVSEEIFTSLLSPTDVLIKSINSCIILNFNTLKALRIRSSSWAKIRIKSANNSKCIYVFKILAKRNVKDDVGIITYSLYNRLNSGSVFSQRTMIVENVEVLKNFVPHIATSVKVGLCQNIDVDNSLLDMALSNYFEYPRHVQINDTLDIDLFKYAPFYYQNLLCSRLFVKITSIEGPLYKAQMYKDVDYGYYIQKEHSSLIQCGNQQAIISSTYTEEIERDSIVDNPKFETINGVPSGLEGYRDELVACIQPFLAGTDRTLQIQPLFLLSGHHGIGKEYVVKSVCEILGLLLWDFDSFELQGGSPGYAEGRLKYIFTKVQQFAPCVLLIKNGEVLCKDKNGNEEDRSSNAFIDEMYRLFRETKFPVIIIVSCNSSNGHSVIVPTLTRIFLHSIQMEIPDDDKRSAMLQWLLRKHGLETNVDLSYLVTQTSGYLYADFIVLLSLAARNMYKRMSRVHSDDDSMDIMLTKADFEESLDAMQTAYSVAIDAPKIPKVSWDDIGGLLDLKKEIIRTVMLPLQRPELLAAGLRRSGILLYGPPGTGKTLLAKAIATECNLNFLSVKGPELLNMYVGQSEENVREVFERARAASPCIIFFDELDSLAPNRGNSGDSGGVMDRVVSQMLAELDGLQKSKLLFVIGATNRPDLIDPALLRPGRFEKLLHVGVCEDKNSQFSVLQTLTKRFKLKSDVNLEDVVSSLPSKLTGADIYSVCSYAWLTAVRNHIHDLSLVDMNASSVIEVGLMDFKEAVKYLMPSVTEDELKYYQNIQKEM